MEKTQTWQCTLPILLTLGIMGVDHTVLPGRQMAPAMAQSSFTDIQNHWAKPCIEELAQRRIISGDYEAKTFRPNAPVMRAEFAAIVRSAFPYVKPVREAKSFVDIPTDYWAYKVIRDAYQTGFISGYSGSIFNPSLNIPRWQVLVSLSSGLKYSSTQPSADVLQATFEDAADIPALARNAIAAAAEKRIVVNYPQVSLLNPNRDASRAEVAAFLCQALAKPNQTALIPNDYIAQVPDNIVPTKTEISVAGQVRAEFSYQSSGEESRNFRLKIVRDQQTVLDESVSLPARSQPANPNLQLPTAEVSEGRFLSLRVLDLDGDREPEVLADLVATKDRENCCNYSFIYRYNSSTKRYNPVKHFWGNVGYELIDLDRDNIPEFRSQDGRFSELFASNSDLRFPLQIWQYRQGKMLDSTQKYPIEVYTNSSELWIEANKRLSQNQEIKGVLASYLASKYVLGQEAEGWQLVEEVYQGSDRAEFLAKLRELMTNTGYANRQTIADTKNNNPTPEKPDNRNQNSANPRTPEKPDNSRRNPVIKPQLSRTLTGSEKQVLSVALSPDRKVLAGGANQQIKLWDVETGKELRTFSGGHDGNVWSVAISPDGQTLLSGSGDGTAILWNLNTGKIRRVLSHGGWVNSVAFSADGKMAISCSHNKGIKVWDVQTGKLLHTLDGVNPMALSATATLASSGGPSEIKLWDIMTGNLRSTLPVPAVAGGGIRAIALSQDGQILAHAMSGNSRILVWDLRNQRLIYTLEGHSEGINAIAISPDGQMLASTSGDRTLKLWNLQTGTLIQSVPGGGAIAFSRDGQILSIAKDNEVEVWELSKR